MAMNERGRSGTITRGTVLGMLSASVALGPQRLRAATEAPTTLRIGQVPSDVYGEALYAQELGSFSRAGFAASLSDFNNGSAMAAALAGGAIDVGITDPLSIANAALHSIPFVFIAGAAVYRSAVATTRLCVAKGSSLQRAVDLEGRSVAVIALGSVMSTAVKAWLTQNGADVAKVRIVEMPFPQMAGALSRGAVDAVTLGEPLFTAASPDVRVLATPYDAIGNEFAISGWFSTREWVTNNAAAAHRFASVIYDTARWANAHQDLSAPMLAKWTNLDLDRIRTMTRAVFATSLEPARIQPVLDAALRFKEIAAPVRASTLVARV